jgi:putative phosphoribosyl transferase
MISPNQFLFNDRTDAGQKLGQFLKTKKFENPVILALPRGGVIIADEIAKLLQVPMDVVVSRKIGAPGHPEFGIGAISEDGSSLINPSVSSYIELESPVIQEIIDKEKIELGRRIKTYRGGHALPEMNGKTVIVIDDGLATGVTAAAAGKFLRSLHPEKLILAVPLGPDDVNPEVKANYDEIICLYELKNMMSVGMWYNHFLQVEDEEVMRVLKKYH